MSLGWKRFRFFDETRLDDASLPENVTASASGGEGETWLGCADGLVVCLDRDLAVKTTFPAFQGRVHCVLEEKVRRSKTVPPGAPQPRSTCNFAVAPCDQP